MPTLPDGAIDICQDKFRVLPKREQLLVVEHIGRGEDVVLIAGCGWGKSLVYFIPLVIWSKGVIVIVSPLRAIMAEQNEELGKLGIKSICLMKGGQAITDATVAELKKRSYRAVFMTPEIMFENRLLRELWHCRGWHSQLLAVVLDEAHCVYLWGNDFRKHYSQLGSLRPKLPPHVAFVAMSATLPPDVLKVVKEKVGFAMDVSVINMGNDRPNIKYTARRMGVGHRHRNLDFLLWDTKKTIVYFSSLSEAKDAYDYLLSQSSSSGTTFGLAGYYSVLSEEYKMDAMERFKRGEVMILLATEAAGMGCNVNDIVRVVQFKAPPCILTLVQRLGRAARSPMIQGEGILLYTLHEAMGNVADQRVLDFISTDTCRREILNRIFDNQPPPNAICCDNCHPSLDGTGLMTPKPHQIIYTLKGQRRTQEERAQIRTMLLEWRLETFNKDYSGRNPFLDEECVMTGEVLDKLVDKFTSISTAQDISTISKWSPKSKDYFVEVAAIFKVAGEGAAYGVPYITNHTSVLSAETAQRRPPPSPRNTKRGRFINSSAINFNK